MSAKYFQAQDFDYFFKAEPRELSIYDSLAWADNFNHTVEGQGGIVLRTLTDEVRRLNKVVHDANKHDEWQKEWWQKNMPAPNVERNVFDVDGD